MNNYLNIIKTLNFKIKQVYKGFANVFEVNPSWHNANYPLLTVETTNSVGVLIYFAKTEQIIVVTQKRAGMITSENQNGLITESIAGRFDNDIKSAITLAIQETKEESGIELSEKEIIVLNNGQGLALSPGIITEKMVLVVAIVPDEIPIHSNDYFGNENEGESITRSLLNFTDIKNGTYLFEDLKLYAMCQWLINYLDKK